jgi:hypothetical protein
VKGEDYRTGRDRARSQEEELARMQSVCMDDVGPEAIPDVSDSPGECRHTIWIARRQNLMKWQAMDDALISSL